MEIERRSNLRPVEVRADQDGGSWLTGYAVVFYDPDNKGTQYDIFEGHVERVDRSAFDDTDWTQTISVFNHDFNQVPLGTTRSGTLSVEVDNIGVKYRVKLPESATSVREAVERGDVAGSSFSWPPDAWTVKRSNDGDFTVHTITKIDRVTDVSPVTWPAYTATSAEMKSRSQARVVEQEDALKEEQKRFEAEEAARAKANLYKARANERVAYDMGYCAST